MHSLATTSGPARKVDVVSIIKMAIDIPVYSTIYEMAIYEMAIYEMADLGTDLA